MTYGSGPTAPTIVTDWRIAARVKGAGKPHVYTATGSAEFATFATRAWLEGLTIEGDRVTIEIKIEVTSAQIPGGKEKKDYYIEGLPVSFSIGYARAWLAAVGTLTGWGGGGP